MNVDLTHYRRLLEIALESPKRRVMGGPDYIELDLNIARVIVSEMREAPHTPDRRNLSQLLLCLAHFPDDYPSYV